MNARSFLFFLMACCCGCTVYAQSETMLTGKIVDSAGANLRRCSVRVLGCEKRDSSDKDGVYRLYLPPGRYELELAGSGRAPHRRKIEIPPVDFYEVDFVVATAP